MQLGYRTATLSDIEKTLELHYRYQIDSISEKDKKDGFVTTPFTEQQLTDLVLKEKGLFIALRDDQVVAYAMAASWQFWSTWPMYAYMIKDLPNIDYKGFVLNTENSYQYGPICVDQSVRGLGVFETLFEFALKEMSYRYPVLVTFVNKINPRSVAAHTNKARLDTIKEFEYNNNHYLELACLTQR